MPAENSTRTPTRSRAGLHGVGVSVVNALSEVLDLRIWRDGQEYFMRFNATRRRPRRRWRRLAGAGGKHSPTPAPRSPSGRAPCTFTKTEFDFATLEHRLRELAFLNSGVTLELTDARGVEPKTVDLHYEGGLEAFVE